MTAQTKITSALILLTLLAVACADEKASGDPPIVLPTAEELAIACNVAESELRRLAEKEGVIAEPIEDEYVVRASTCVRDDNDPPALKCRFEMAIIPIALPDGEGREQYLARLRSLDWEPAAARLVPANRPWRWSVPASCRQVQAP